MSQKQALKYRDSLALTKPMGSSPETLLVQLVPGLQLSQKDTLLDMSVGIKASMQDCSVNVLLEHIEA